MKTILYLVLALLLTPNISICQDKGVIIKGNVIGADEDYVILAYLPRMRGNLNFDKFKSIGSEINEKGGFEVRQDSITPGANYRLFFPNNYVSLNLFDGDSLHIDINLEKSTQFFCSGKGAGKINILNLKQFQYAFLDLDRERNFSQFKNYVDSITQYRLELLEQIRLRKTNSPILSKAANSDLIKKIINESPINYEEYTFVKNIIHFDKYSLLTRFLMKEGSKTEYEKIPLNLKEDFYEDFDLENYKIFSNINDWRAYNSFENILQIEYLKYHEREVKIPEITHGNFLNLINTKEFRDWSAQFVKSNFSNEIFYKYYGDYSTGLMTWGIQNEDWFKYLKNSEPNKYLNRVLRFQDLINNGLSRKDYDLGNEFKNLDKSKFEKLIEKNKDLPIYIVFWSAQAAGASVIDELPSIKHFEKKMEGKVNVLYICVDKKKNKELWAARVIDEEWRGSHYFMSIEGNESTLNDFSAKNISSLCSGGASYSFINKSGKIFKDSQGPFYMNKIDFENLTK